MRSAAATVSELDTSKLLNAARVPGQLAYVVRGQKVT